MHLQIWLDQSKGVQNSGLTGFWFNTVGVSDGISIGN
jgi:hypothetical protein